MPGSAREEAERLVAAVLARASAGGPSSGDAFGLLGESVAGLIGFLQFATAAVASYVTGLMIEQGPLPMIVLMLAVSVAGVACAGLLFSRPGRPSRV